MNSDTEYWISQCAKRDVQIARLSAAIRRYGKHPMMCARTAHEPCDCGLDALKDELERAADQPTVAQQEPK